MKNHWAFCADVGSIPKGNFGWASSIDGKLKSGNDIGIFAADIANAIKSECKVSIGFECPLFIPVRNEPITVAAARTGEGQRSWSAGAGTGALATGMVQSLWVMRRIKTIIGYIDCTTNASIANWLLSPNSENKTNDTMLRNELGVSQVSTSSLLLRANV